MVKSLPFVVTVALLASAAVGSVPHAGAADAQANAGVTLTDHSASVVLDNGILTATIEKSTAHVSSLKFHGREMTRAKDGIYYSMDGGKDYERPQGCVYEVKASTPDLVDIGMRRPYTNQVHAFDIEIHYVLRRGDSGLYTYALLDHPASYPAAHVNEWRVVWKLPDDLLERICVDSARCWQMPSAADLAQAKPTPIKEIVAVTTGVRAGFYDCKYAFNSDYWKLDCWGHASDRNKLGAWAVFGSHEFFNDGPTKQDLTSASGLIHVHFGLDHYNASMTNVSAGEAWRKIYGPLLLYCNAAESSDASWADAKARASADHTAWPFAWLADNSEYPLAASRGSVSGKFVVRDPLKPDVSAAGAWIGLAQPQPGGNWQFDSLRYQYWTQAGADGSFSISNVRPGAYTLSAFTDGAIGEFTQSGVAVEAGKAKSLGDLEWQVPHTGTKIAWEIGKPDRTARKFRDGDDYFEPYLWQKFSSDFPNPLEYFVGKSNPATDWNYAQCGYLKDGAWSPWPWRIHFDLDAAPQSGEATLVLAFAGADRCRVAVTINDDQKPLAIVTPSVSGGNALAREGVHAKYCVERVAIPAAKLRAGSNTITLVTDHSDSAFSHVMYDSLSLELPAH